MPFIAISTGVWDVSNVLEATYQKGDFEPHTLSIEVEDVPGVLNQVSTAAYPPNMPVRIKLQRTGLCVTVLGLAF